MGLPVRREFPIETPAPWSPAGPAWWPTSPGQQPAEEPTPAPEPVRGPDEVPA